MQPERPARARAIFGIVTSLANVRHVFIFECFLHRSTTLRLSLCNTQMMTNITAEFTTLMNSSSNFSQHYHPFDESSALKWTRLFAYGVVFLLGVVGNLLVIRAIGDLQMRNVTNLFITNLAISDLIVSLVNIPFVVTHAHLGYWPFGSVLCKIIPFIQGTSVCSYSITF